MPQQVACLVAKARHNDALAHAEQNRRADDFDAVDLLVPWQCWVVLRGQDSNAMTGADKSACQPLNIDG